VIIRLAATAYELPTTVETAASVMERERERVESALAAVSPPVRNRTMAKLGIERVRTCGSLDPYELMIGAARAALHDAGIAGKRVNLIVDFSTLPGEAAISSPLAHRLAADLGAETSLNLSFKLGGCAGFHLAVMQAAALMRSDTRLKVALLVATDSPPPGSRSLLPVTIQGDAGSAAILRADGGEGPEIKATEVLTLGHLHQVITLERAPVGNGLELRIDPSMLEAAVMPVYYLHFHRLVHKVLSDARLTMPEIDHFIYSNLSDSDRDGFIRALGIPPGKEPRTSMLELGHTFASDLVLNYTDLRREGRIRPGQWLLFASAGIGFSWGVTLARA
jgi:3-oxoacyl-[acyl-carrier-protein] synthase-3